MMRYVKRIHLFSFNIILLKQGTCYLHIHILLLTFVYSEFLLINSFKPTEADHEEQCDHAPRTVRNSFPSSDRLESCLCRLAKQEHLSLLALQNIRRKDETLLTILQAIKI